MATEQNEKIDGLVPEGVAVPERAPTKGRRKASKTRKPETIGDLTPDISVHETDTFWFHAGLHESFDGNNSQIDIAGIPFPKATECIYKDDPNLGFFGQVRRERVRGILVRLSRAQLEKLGERLRVTVLRPTRGYRERVSGNVENLDSPQSAKPTYIKLSIPTAEDVKARKDAGIITPRPYIAQDGDVPLACMIYLVSALERPLRHLEFGEPCPAPLSESGIALPGDDWPTAQPDDRISNGGNFRFYG